MLKLICKDNAILLPVKVVPGASRTCIASRWQGRIRVSVTAPAERGRANQALIEFLADLFGVRSRRIEVVAGHHSSTKTVRIEQITEDAVRAALQDARPTTKRRIS